MNSDPEFEAFADEAVSSWGMPGGELEAAISATCRSRLKFPPASIESQRDESITDRASRDTCEIGTSFDGLVDT